MPRPLGSVSIILLTALFAAGCETAPKAPDTPARPIAPGGASTASSSQEVVATRPAPWEDPASPIYRRVIYFSYDRSDIPPDYVVLLRTHADYLAKHPDTRITIDGHTDERGTREYNLALGDQRAAAVRRFLIAEGVPERQMSTLSYGEEKPANPGHDESSWALNRRAELDYQGH